ncbi:MAG: hypothetical protein ACOZAM_09095 [Pseudomonadota bacterium]
MVNIDVCFGWHRGYRTAIVELHGRSLAFSFSLRAGQHSFRSEAFEIGTVHALDGRKLLASVAFDYRYDQEERTVTLYSTDYVSRNAMHLVTALQRSSGCCLHPAASTESLVDDPATVDGWCSHIPFTPGLEEALRGLARSANAALIATLEHVPGLNVEVLRRSPELRTEDFRVVYRSGTFLGLYEPGRLYGPEDTVVHVDSVYRGTTTLAAHAKFANVIGSTPDPKVGSRSWLRLWIYKTQRSPPTKCTSLGFSGFNCNKLFVGGHVVSGTNSMRMRAGSAQVMIIPICVRHNNDDSVFMEARWNGRMAVTLKKYLRR